MPTETTVRGSPSTSESFASRAAASIVKMASSFMVNASSAATGGSFTGVTVTVTLAEAVASPSVIS